jgi:hypothetical protein
MQLARARRPRLALRAGPSWERTAGGLQGPLFAGVDAGVAYRGGFGWSGRRPRRGPRRGLSGGSVSVTVRHVRGGAELEVETSDEPDATLGGLHDWRLAADWAARVLRPDRLVFPLTLTAQRWQQDVVVDGAAVPFVFVGGADTWVGLGAVGVRQVAVAGTDWSARGLSLRAVSPREVSGAVPSGLPG